MSNLNLTSPAMRLTLPEPWASALQNIAQQHGGDAKLIAIGAVVQWIESAEMNGDEMSVLVALKAGDEAVTNEENQILESAGNG